MDAVAAFRRIVDQAREGCELVADVARLLAELPLGRSARLLALVDEALRVARA